jgi:thioredoxin reductase (NADPH)
MFFCKDCDGYRVQNRSVAVYGWSNETAEYALAMRIYTKHIIIVTDGRKPRWNRRHGRWIRSHGLQVIRQTIRDVRQRRGQIRALVFKDAEVPVEGLFTTRGDIYFSKLAENLGAKLNRTGEIVVGIKMKTTVNGLYAAGCVTPANCQMIIAAGQGATAAQSINRDLFEDSLKR